jgi:hypothetical protein
MRNTTWVKTFAVALLLAVSASGLTAYSQTSKEETYQWSAELVAFDQPGGTITVKAMARQDVGKQAAALKSGDKVLLTWSGFEKYAHDITGIQRHSANLKADARFAFPAEFVSFAANNYLTFKVPAPADAATRLKDIKPGQWVTATSRHGAAAETQAVVAVRGYNDLESSQS